MEILIDEKRKVRKYVIWLRKVIKKKEKKERKYKRGNENEQEGKKRKIEINQVIEMVNTKN